jgi:hypothetical protein
MAKCPDCGFLAARNRKTRELLEVEKVMRDNGNITDTRDQECIRVYDNTVCFFMRKYDLPAE